MKRSIPITLDGPYPKRIRRVVRARRTWGLALVAVVVALLCHFTG